MQGSKMVENAGESITEKSVETVLHTVQRAIQGDIEAITLLAAGYLLPAALSLLASFRWLLASQLFIAGRQRTGLQTSRSNAR